MTTNRRSTVPSPPHPHQRRQPLPGHRPKPAEEDPRAPGSVEAILDSPSYRLAERDADFIGRAEIRGPRLEIEYLKADTVLADEHIEHTIVVFGSTRICEPETARRNVEALRELTKKSPRQAELSARLTIAERILAKSHYYNVAREFGRIVSEADRGPLRPKIVVMTGGGPGLMEAANRGAHDAAAKSIGLNIELPHEQYPNPYVTPSLCFRFHYFALRKLHFLLRAKALIAFPGGYGTIDELFEVLTLIQTRKIKPIPVVLVGEAYWRRAVDFDFFVEEGVIDPEDRDLFWFAETAPEIWDGIQRWYEAFGEPL